VKVKVGLNFEIKFLTQHIGSIFDPNLVSNNPALLTVYLQCTVYISVLHNVIAHHLLINSKYLLILVKNRVSF